MLIDRQEFADIKGLPQAISMRGDDAANPVLLVVSDPGVALSVMAGFFAPWQQAFTVVQWDQPNAGATLAKSGGPVGLHLERLVQDGLLVAEYVCQTLNVRKIAVLGISLGSIIALNLIKRRPDLFSAYVATGQIVNWAHQDFLSFETLLDEARSAGDSLKLAQLESLGPPPYGSPAEDAIKSSYACALTAAEKSAMAGSESEPPTGDLWSAARAGAAATYQALRSEIADFDARNLGLAFAVPMFFLHGELDSHTVPSTVWRYAEEVDAPQKEFDLIDGGGHSVFLMRDAFLAALCFHVHSTAMETAMHHD